MDLIVIGAAAFTASALTFFTGFGLGTILMPVYAIFVSTELAIAMTAIVHFANNVFKFSLLFKHPNWPVVARFGGAAILAALLGAKALAGLSHLPVLFSYEFLGTVRAVYPVKLLMGVLTIFFVIWDWRVKFVGFQPSTKNLIFGGALSGFFGGLSGHQGAFRTMFLTRLGLSKEQFLATGIVIACLVDTTRLFTYRPTVETLNLPVVVGIAAALMGAVLGYFIFKKATLEKVQTYIAWALVLLGLGLISGLI